MNNKNNLFLRLILPILLLLVGTASQSHAQSPFASEKKGMAECFCSWHHEPASTHEFTKFG